MAAAKRQARVDGYGEKITVKIMSIDKARNRVECATRDGAMIFAAIWETPTVFRWPEAGEVWTVRKDTGVWRLDQQIQTELAEIESTATPVTLEDLPEGDTRITGNTVHVNNLAINGSSTTPIWITPELPFGWEPYGNSPSTAPSYCKDILGFVHIRGTIKNTKEEIEPPGVIFTLDYGYEPDFKTTYVQWGRFAAASNDMAIGVSVDTLGQVSLTTNAIEVTFLTLNIDFYAG